MRLVVPEIVAEAVGLSVPVLIAFLAVGLALWLFGWRTHRFWLVLVATVLGGLYGLSEAAVFRTQPLVAAILLAITAGVLALAVVRLLAFAVGGIGGLWAMQAFFPAWDQTFVAFIACGLVGLFLFRVSIMALTSLTGSLFMTYAGLCLGNHYGQVPALRWSEDRGDLLTWICGGLAAFGLLLQFVQHRRRLSKKKDKKEEDEPEDSWFHPVLGLYRKAG